MDHLLSGTVRKCPLLCPAVEEERLQHFQEAIYAELKPLTVERSMCILQKCAAVFLCSHGHRTMRAHILTSRPRPTTACSLAHPSRSSPSPLFPRHLF
jgi:hypothetical protein